MARHRVPAPIEGNPVVRFDKGCGIGHCVGSMPRDAEFEVRNGESQRCGGRMERASVELTAPAELMPVTGKGSAG